MEAKANRLGPKGEGVIFQKRMPGRGAIDTRFAMLFWFLAVPVAILVRAFTTEEIAREARDYCSRRQTAYHEKQQSAGASLARRAYCFTVRKLHYIPTCDYCLSFWVSLVVVLIAQYEMEFNDWRGTALACFVVMGVANVYLALFTHLRIDARKERALAEHIEGETQRAE